MPNPRLPWKFQLLLFLDFGRVLRQICPYLKVLEMLTVCHYKCFGDNFYEARLFCI